MSKNWINIIKFEPQQTPKRSLAAKQTLNIDSKPIPQKEKQKYVVSITQQFHGTLHGKWSTLHPSDIQKFDTRDEAKEFLIEMMYKFRNPAPWTVEGNNIEGHCVVYDGIMMSITAPAYYYLIHEEREKKPDAASFNPRVDWTSGAAVMNRMNNRPFGEGIDE